MSQTEQDLRTLLAKLNAGPLDRKASQLRASVVRTLSDLRGTR